MTWTDVMLDELGRIELFSVPFNYLEEVEKQQSNGCCSNSPRR
jgi:hypothetical protein